MAELARRAVLAAAAAGALVPVLGASADRPLAAVPMPGFASLRPGALVPEGWREERLRGVAPNQHELVSADARTVLRIGSRRSASSLVWRFPAPLRATRLAWRWCVDAWPAAAAHAAFGEKAGDDFGLRLYLLFDYPTDRVPIADRMLLALARTLHDPGLPAAALCYVADPRVPAGTVVSSPYSARVKITVLRSEPQPGAWWAEDRNLPGDFQRAFGEEHGPGMPPIAAVALAADTDQAGGELHAFFGDLAWTRAPE
jgi:hypothetical protein